MIRIIGVLWLILLVQSSGSALANVSHLSSRNLANSGFSTLELSNHLSTSFQKEERPTHNIWLVADHRPEKGADKPSNSNRQRWENLTPSQREKIEQRRKHYESLPPMEKQRIKRAREQFRDLPPNRQRELRDRWKKSTPDKRRDKYSKPKRKDKNKKQ